MIYIFSALKVKYWGHYFAQLSNIVPYIEISSSACQYVLYILLHICVVIIRFWMLGIANKYI